MFGHHLTKVLFYLSVLNWYYNTCYELSHHPNSPVFSLFVIKFSYDCKRSMSSIARVNCYEILHSTKYVLPIWSAEELDLTSSASLIFSWRMKMHVLKPLGMTEIRFVKLVTSGLRVLTLVSGSTKYLTGSKGAKKTSNECPIHTYNLRNRLSFPCWNLNKCCCSICKLIWKQLQASNEEHLWWGMLPAINLSLWFLSLILKKENNLGLSGSRTRDLSHPKRESCH